MVKVTSSLELGKNCPLLVLERKASQGGEKIATFKEFCCTDQMEFLFPYLLPTLWGITRVRSKQLRSTRKSNHQASSSMSHCNPC